MTTLTWAQVHAWRLARHHLLERAPRDRLLDVAADLCGVHAQVMSAAELALWARVRDVTPADVRDALWTRRALVKIWAMRGTLHLFPAAVLPTYVAAAQTRRHYLAASWLKGHGVTLAEEEAIIAGVRVALDGRCLTREQLADEVARLAGAPHLRDLLLSGWGALLKPAAYRGYLCFGPSQGQAVTFVRPDQWLADWREEEPGPALQEVLRCYLSTYGPATREDFERWWGMEPREARALLASLAGELTEVTVEGWRAWALAATVAPMQASPTVAPVRLLPYFDPYVVGLSRHRRALLPAAHRARIYREAGWISPVVLVGGEIAGVWESAKVRARVQVQVTWFAPPDAAVQAGVAAEAERLGAFLGTPVDVIESVFSPTNDIHRPQDHTEVDG